MNEPERSLIVTSLGNFSAPWCTEVHLAATMQEMGIEVVEVQEDKASLADLEAALAGSDLFLYTRTPGFWKGGPKPLLNLLKHLEIPSASYHLDLYHGLPRGQGLKSDPFWRTKYVFTPDGSPEAAAHFAAEGVNHIYMKPGVYAGECYLAKPKPEYAVDVTFVGSGTNNGGYHPEWPYRGKLISWLRKTYGGRFVKHGPPEDTTRGHALNSLYASAKVIVGDTLCPGFNKALYWSDRCYETLGRGGFLIHPRIAGMEEEFVDGEHLVFYEYNDFAGLKDKVDHYLAHPEERERIRQVGHEFVKARCTYTQRLTQFFEYLSDHEPTLAEKWDSIREAA